MRRVVVSAPGISHQAQNALLKMLEDAQDGVSFFFCLPSGTEVLDTLLSRCYLVEEKEQGTKDTFSTATVKKRLELIDEIWSRTGAERHVAVLQLLQQTEEHLHKRVISGEKVTDGTRALANLRDALAHGALHKGTLQALAFL